MLGETLGVAGCILTRRVEKRGEYLGCAEDGNRRPHLYPTQSHRTRLNGAPSRCVGHPPWHRVRVLDLKLAEWAELAQPRNIRRVIVGIIPNLETLGILTRRVKIHPGAGRPSVEYRLNEEQVYRASAALSLVDLFPDLLQALLNLWL